MRCFRARPRFAIFGEGVRSMRDADWAAGSTLLLNRADRPAMVF